MGIGEGKYQSHLEAWSDHFQNYKKRWPKYLFRHEPVENLIPVLRSGRILSRNDAGQQGAIRNDIAPVGIIQNRDDAHSSVRLYFRPRTPTQYHIEGIRKVEHYYQGKHGGFLAILAFDARLVLTMSGARFSTGNMQSPASQVLDGDAGFDQLDFVGIYHDEPYPSDDQRRKRCAEVLLKSPFSLDALKYILVRTDADVTAVKHLLVANDCPRYLPLVEKSNSVGTFFNRFTALDFIDIGPGKIYSQLRFYENGLNVHTRMDLYDLDRKHLKKIVDQELVPLKRYQTVHGMPPGSYILSSP